ncbi:sulfotransferase [Loktanella sp. SALINAS62]|uniref:sulfotransferase family protein n=1 Tax=Loktanella sp. SALINAS62 TaxID=2706124 RepID=UPI001B8D25C6|nr:sulfotransferase domain-containing protein [Loktanella sp. SALINAS62]
MQQDDRLTNHQSAGASRASAPVRLDAAIIGAQKSATTTLFDRIAAHPDVSGCEPKEPHFFIRDDWETHLDEYASMFPEPAGRLTLEASTTYSFAQHSDVVARRLHAHNPHMRIIYVVREPVARIVSAYRHAASRRYKVAPTIGQAVATPSRLVDNTRYAARLKPFRDLFGADRVLILTFEEVTTRQSDCLAQVQTFLGLPPIRLDEVALNRSSTPKLHHRHDGRRWMEAFARTAPRFYERFAKERIDIDDRLQPETETALRRALASDIEVIERWSGRDLSRWRN